MRSYRICRTMICVSVPLLVVGCSSTSALNCAGFRANNLNPAAMVAVIKLDRPAAERIEGNDANGERQGCW